MRRALKLCLPLLLVLLVLGGCSSKGSSTGTSSSGSQPTGAVEPAVAKGIVAMTPTTAGEKSALKLAATDEGRKWASGNPDGSMGVAAGEPMLAGYQVQLNDGKKTGYTVLVLNGEVRSIFGPDRPPKVDDAIIVWDYDKTNMYTRVNKPEGADQEKALQLAIDYVLANKKVKTTGGIEAYSIAFPTNENNQWPMVQLFANTDTGKFSSGGMSLR